MPLHKFEIAQVPCFIIFLLIVEITNSHKLIRPPIFKTKSLLSVESPAMLPIAQRAYSATIRWGLFNNSTNKGIPPNSIIF